MTGYDSLSDIELVNLIKLNDQLAFTELYHRFYGLLFVHACKVSRDKIVAQDLVQDIFINLWDKRQSIHFTTSVSSYLYSSIRYKFFNLVDRQKVRLDYIQAYRKGNRELACENAGNICIKPKSTPF